VIAGFGIFKSVGFLVAELGGIFEERLMSLELVLNATLREDAGKGASRRLRRLENQVPAIVYGGTDAPLNIQVPHKDLTKQLENEAFYTQIVTINIGGKNEQVLLKDLQRHPSKALLLHADFMRVSKDQKVTVKVPFHFLNEDNCKGVKLQGGMINRGLTELEVSCLPADLPESISIDLINLEVGQLIYISDLQLPEGVVSVQLALGAEHDDAVVSILKPRGAAEEDEAQAEEDGEAK
jgi:large subunit ribosomal protein L25